MELRLLPDPVLRETCTPVTVFDAALEDVVAEMLAVMYAAPGRGLAAPQVGIIRAYFRDGRDVERRRPEPDGFYQS